MRSFLLIALLSALGACGSEAVTVSAPQQYDDSRYEGRRLQPVGGTAQPEPKPEVQPQPMPQPMPQPAPQPAPVPMPVDMSIELPNPRLSGYLIQTTPDSYTARVSVDQANAAVAARFEWPLLLPVYKTASLRTVSLAAAAAWLPASTLCDSMGKPGAALIERPGNVKLCITQRWTVSVVVDGAEMVVALGNATQIAASLQAGTSISLQPGQRVSLRLDIFGNADISKLDADVIARIQQ